MRTTVSSIFYGDRIDWPAFDGPVQPAFRFMRIRLSASYDMNFLCESAEVNAKRNVLHQLIDLMDFLSASTSDVEAVDP